MAGNSQNHSGFNFLCPWPSNHLKASYFAVCFVVSCHSVSANALKEAAFSFFLDSLFFFFFLPQALFQLYLRCQTTITTVSWGLTGSNFSLCVRDVLSQRLLCAALKSGWPVEISISPLIVFSSVPFNMVVHQCSGSFTWGTLKSCSVPVCISFKADLQAWPTECHRQRADLRVKHCK